jgi:hypothetical protein
VKYGTACGALQDPGVTPPATENSPTSSQAERSHDPCGSINAFESGCRSLASADDGLATLKKFQFSLNVHHCITGFLYYTKLHAVTSRQQRRPFLDKRLFRVWLLCYVLATSPSVMD